MHWYFPSCNGDVRISTDPEDPRHTLVTVIEPTANELELLERANAVFRAKKWVHASSKLWKLSGDQQRQETRVEASLLEVGLILVGRLKPGLATLTAVTTVEGKVEAMGSAEAGYVAWIGKAMQGDVGAMPNMVNLRDEVGYAQLMLAKAKAEIEERDEREAKAAKAARAEAAAKELEAKIAEAKAAEAAARKAKADKETAAATVKRPTPSCPQSIPGIVEAAQEVLLRFCDAEQRQQWLSERRLIARGNLTGHRYLIAHRHTPTAIQIGKCTFDLDEVAPMHFHDWTVPPEEEVLAVKLILEHREPWLRNEATCLGHMGMPRTEVFKNPFGDGLDGLPDAGLTEDLGRAFMRPDP